MTRPLFRIAADIWDNWPKPHYAAVPYLVAMASLSNINEAYYLDDGRTVVLYFLSNARTWRGPDARRIKAELNALLGCKS